MFLGAAIVLILYVFQLKCGTFIGKIAYEVTTVPYSNTPSHNAV
jgi:hypothetical protein